MHTNHSSSSLVTFKSCSTSVWILNYKLNCCNILVETRLRHRNIDSFYFTYFLRLFCVAIMYAHVETRWNAWYSYCSWVNVVSLRYLTKQSSALTKRITLVLTRWYEQGVSLFDRTLIAHVNLVPKEHLILVRWWTPSLKKCQVGRGGGN